MLIEQTIYQLEYEGREGRRLKSPVLFRNMLDAIDQGVVHEQHGYKNVLLLIRDLARLNTGEIVI